VEAPGDVDITIHGTGFRPFMRLSFDNHQGRTFMFGDATTALVHASDLPPGIYDVILYDNAQERARLPKGFEVVAAPRPQALVDLIGAFTAIAEPLAAQIKPELPIAGLGQIARVGRPQPASTRAIVGPSELLNVPSNNAVNIPAVIRASCAVAPRGGSAVCSALGNPLMRDAVLSVPLSGGNALFQIDEVRVADAANTIDVRARLTGERAVVDRVRRGDRDVERPNEFSMGAEIISASPVARATSSVIVAAQLQAGAIPAITAGDLATVEVVIRVPAHQTADGWWYRGQPMIGGRSFMFHGPQYELSGTVLTIATK